MKKIFKILFLTTFLLTSVNFLPNTAFANDIEEKTVNLYFFYGEGCPHCEKEKPFLRKMEEKYENLKVHSYEIWYSSENRNLFMEFGKKLSATVNGVPFTVIGEKYFTGWLDEETTGAQIEQEIICAVEEGCRDVLSEINGGIDTTNQDNKSNLSLPETLDLPLIGEIKTKNLSLPLLTLIVAALDGFNPCAMWTLLFLISLLLGMQNKVRMWTLGTAFIIASAGVYFLFLSAWLNLLLFIGLIFWIRIIIGLVALGGGGFYLKEYFKNPQGTCVVTKSEKRKKVFEKLKALTHQSNFWLALIGIILLAAAVNLVEVICSAGLPAVYTQVLSLSDLKTWQYYGYLLFYIFIFMLDDLVIFFTAMITLQVTGVSGKYSRLSHLIGGALMIIIGILLIFRPEWLMFG
ncbi:MAG: thioredoxin family protein [Candidatus Gracilibacteria bacterium]|jgi:thiol-disulfide isomerase/thioredoxin|nr:thioredoxin family protein [Candidatus Gracilibacteria bacterium]